MQAEKMEFAGFDEALINFCTSIAFIGCEIRIKDEVKNKSLLFNTETKSFDNEEVTTKKWFINRHSISDSKDTWLETKDAEVYLVKAIPVIIGTEEFVIETKSLLQKEILENAFSTLNIGVTLKSLTDKIYRDSLTNAYNRNFLNEQANELVIDALAIIDMDNFKTINDTYGHLAGDDALRLVSDTIRASVRPKDILIRYGGDEFILLMKDICMESFELRMTEVCNRLNSTKLKEYPNAKLSCSIGGFMTKKCCDSAIKEADKNMYIAKQQRNVVHIS